MWCASDVITICGDFRANSATLWSPVETSSESYASVIFPSIGPCSDAPLSSSGSRWDRFAAFTGTMRALRLPATLRASLSFASPYRP
jgi:hypothetical protein